MEEMHSAKYREGTRSSHALSQHLVHVYAPTSKPPDDLFCFCFKILFIYSLETERGAETQAEGEAGASHSPMWDLIQDHAEPKTDAQPLSHPGVPIIPNLNVFYSLVFSPEV